MLSLRVMLKIADDLESSDWNSTPLGVCKGFPRGLQTQIALRNSIFTSSASTGTSSRVLEMTLLEEAILLFLFNLLPLYERKAYLSPIGVP